MALVQLNPVPAHALLPLPEPPHSPLHLLHILHIRPRLLPQNLPVTLVHIPADPIHVQYPVHNIRLILPDLIPPGDGVFQAPQPVPRRALADLVLGGELVGEEDDGEEEGVRDLEGAGLDVLDCVDERRGGRPLCVAGRYGGLEGVGEHCFPAAGLALFADVGLAEDDFWGALDEFVHGVRHMNAVNLGRGLVTGV